jgi:hypothetical protein
VVCIEQRLGALLQPRPPRPPRRELRRLDLGADELGPLRVAVVVQPVGVDQARSIIVGIVADVAEDGVALRHAHTLDRATTAILGAGSARGKRALAARCRTEFIPFDDWGASERNEFRSTMAADLARRAGGW